jgi:hypothetical protein
VPVIRNNGNTFGDRLPNLDLSSATRQGNHPHTAALG